MSYEQKEDFAVPTWVMTQVLMLTILGTLFGSLIIFVIMLSREEKRRRDELRAKRARRLRYLKDARNAGSNCASGSASCSEIIAVSLARRTRTWSCQRCPLSMSWFQSCIQTRRKAC